MSGIRVAVVGVGYLGRFHAEKYAALASTELVAVCDAVPDVATSVAAALDTSAVSDPRALIGQVDAVTIAASTSAHFELAKLFLEHDVHVFIEKPMTRTSAEAAVLVQMAEARTLKLQVGHIERFNPALLAARERLTEVRFIECHRLAAYKPRGVDVDVVRDLMIHDLDVILTLIRSRPRVISAVGIPVLTDKADIANARIEFESGAIANVTASRVSTTTQRKFRVFQPNQYVSIDFDSGKVQRVTSEPQRRQGDSPFTIDEWNLQKGDALMAEVESFVESIVNDTPCQVSGKDGQSALELAEAIVARIEERWT
jgi:predicted dehydrogenase